MRKLAVLGCGGFIGSHCLDALLADPECQVEGWDWTADKILPHLGHPRFQFHAGDLYADPGLEGRLEGCDTVIALAALCRPGLYNTRPLDVIESNFTLPRRIADFCARRGKWLIQFSTSEVYGQTLAHWTGDGQERPELVELDEDASPYLLGPLSSQRWSYACAKQLLERSLFALHKEKGLAFTLIRPFNFLGPRMDFLPGGPGEETPRVLACFAAAVLRRSPLQLVDGGNNRRTFLAVEEAVEGLLRMLRRPDRAQGQVFNLGNPANETTIRGLAERMRTAAAAVTGDPGYLDLPLQSVSAAEFYGEGYADSDRRMPRIDKARELLGWSPSKPLDAILRDVLEPLLRDNGGPQTYGGSSQPASSWNPAGTSTHKEGQKKPPKFLPA